MFTLIRNVQSRDGLLVEAPSCITSILIAETFYKFHSFTLECICFLLTWLAISSLVSLIVPRTRSTAASS